jgi:hypothetical protein
MGERVEVVVEEAAAAAAEEEEEAEVEERPGMYKHRRLPHRNICCHHQRIRDPNTHQS